MSTDKRKTPRPCYSAAGRVSSLGSFAQYAENYVFKDCAWKDDAKEKALAALRFARGPIGAVNLGEQASQMRRDFRTAERLILEAIAALEGKP